jgi:hypothetical protein
VALIFGWIRFCPDEGHLWWGTRSLFVRMEIRGLPP